MILCTSGCLAANVTCRTMPSRSACRSSVPGDVPTSRRSRSRSTSTWLIAANHRSCLDPKRAFSRAWLTPSCRLSCLIEKPSKPCCAKARNAASSSASASNPWPAGGRPRPRTLSGFAIAGTSDLLKITNCLIIVKESFSIRCAPPHLEADTMSRPETCRIAAEPADYERYGIAKDNIAAWEDGFRTRPGGPGTFEWWYFDAVLDDDSTLVINFMVKDIRGGGGIKQPPSPLVTFELDRPDGTHVERSVHAQEDFAFAADRCDVRVGANTFAGDLHTYRIHLEIEGVTADVTLTGHVPPWRPETGHILFGDDHPHLFAWLPAVPQGTVQATLSVDGETRTLTGTGYHDHNWGDAAM